jgi:hypothetical protein
MTVQTFFDGLIACLSGYALGSLSTGRTTRRHSGKIPRLLSLRLNIKC